MHIPQMNYRTKECRLKTEIAMTKQVMFCQNLSFWNFLFRTIETLLIEGVVIFTEILIKINIFLHFTFGNDGYDNFKSSRATQHCRRCSVTDDYFSIFGMQWYSYYLLHRFLQISMNNPKLYFEGVVIFTEILIKINIFLHFTFGNDGYVKFYSTTRDFSPFFTGSHIFSSSRIK
jgi:hypothetical protein